MNYTVPYYLSSSYVGVLASQYARMVNFRSRDTPKWKILPLSIFDESDSGQKVEDEDPSAAPRPENLNKSDQDQEEHVESKVEAETTQTPAEDPPIPHKVGMDIPLIPDEEEIQVTNIPPFPTQWNRKEKSAGLEISPNGLRVTYVGELSPDPPENSARSVRANYPISFQGGIFYYEVSIIDKGGDSHNKSIIGIGFSHTNVLLNRLPGWEEGSWGYHGDDGNCFCNSGSGRGFGPTYTAGDVIGCIINYIDSTASFTKNGINLGVAFTNIRSEQNVIPTLYPTVGLQTHGEIIEANFGHTKFLFDIEGYFMEQKEKIWKKIMNSPLLLDTQGFSSNLRTATPVSMRDELDSIFDIIKRLIFSYLIHSGYVDTAKGFYESLSLGKSSTDFENSAKKNQMKKMNIASEFTMGKSIDCSSFTSELEDAATLKTIYNMLLNGEIDDAIKVIDSSYPGFLEQNRNIDFALQCRRYVEIVYKFSKNMQNQDNPLKNSESHVNESQVVTPPTNGTSNGQSWYSSLGTDGVRSPSAGECEALNNMIECGQDIYKRFMLEKNPIVRSTLVKVFSLSSYPNAFDSPVAYLLNPSCRKVIADTVNKAILVFKGYSCASALDIFYRHASTIVEKLVNNGVYLASLIDVRGDCLLDNFMTFFLKDLH